MRARIRRDNDFARHVAARARASDRLELMTEPVLSICCLRYVAPHSHDLNALNTTLLRRPQAETPYLPSSTVVNGHFVIRPCFINGRTELEHVDGFCDAVIRIGDELARSVPAPSN